MNLDINVKMFESMYHNRLRAYKKLGYVISGDEVIFERKIYSTYDYKAKLYEDLIDSKKEVVFVINDYNDEVVIDLLNTCGNVKIFTHSNKTIEHKNISSLLKTNLEINAVIIDQKYFGMEELIPLKQLHIMTR